MPRTSRKKRPLSARLKASRAVDRTSWKAKLESTKRNLLVVGDGPYQVLSCPNGRRRTAWLFQTFERAETFKSWLDEPYSRREPVPWSDEYPLPWCSAADHDMCYRDHELADLRAGQRIA